MFKEIFQNLTEAKILKSGDEIKKKRSEERAVYIRLIKKIGEKDLVELKMSNGPRKGKTVKISTDVLRSQYDLDGKVPA